MLKLSTILLGLLATLTIAVPFPEPEKELSDRDVFPYCIGTRSLQIRDNNGTVVGKYPPSLSQPHRRRFEWDTDQEALGDADEEHDLANTKRNETSVPPTLPGICETRNQLCKYCINGQVRTQSCHYEARVSVAAKILAHSCRLCH
jgi:hypothetical protein